MNRKFTAIVLSLTFISLGGCASMNSAECETGDWRAIGYEDGSRGYTSDRFGDHRKACAKHGVTADFSSYQEGRTAGLAEFCQPSRGFNLGSSGGNYNGVCSANREADFLDAYRAGQQLYTLRSNYNNAASLIYSKERELEEIDIATGENALLLISPETSNEDRVRLMTDMKHLSERKGKLEAEIKMLIVDRARYEQELRNYEQTVAAYGY